MPYHIRLDYFDPKLKVNQTRFSYDIASVDEVQKIIKDYYAGSSLMFEGVKLKSEDIRSMDIYESDNDINTCIAIGDRNLNSPFLCYDKTSIFQEEELIRNITRTMFDAVITKNVPGLPIKEEVIPTKAMLNSKKVFIVHGHDTALRSEVEMTITKLKYKPVVLFKCADKGQTIIEKLESESSSIAFCIVLYTACDKGCAIDKDDLQPRARQNVVFEHGMMCAKLGRERVVALLEEGVEMPGDLGGVIYKKIDSAGHWRFEIAKEMKVAGLDVDANDLFE